MIFRVSFRRGLSRREFHWRGGMLRSWQIDILTPSSRRRRYLAWMMNLVRRRRNLGSFFALTALPLSSLSGALPTALAVLATSLSQAMPCDFPCLLIIWTVLGVFCPLSRTQERNRGSPIAPPPDVSWVGLAWKGEFVWFQVTKSSRRCCWGYSTITRLKTCSLSPFVIADFRNVAFSI